MVTRRLPSSSGLSADPFDETTNLNESIPPPPTTSDLAPVDLRASIVALTGSLAGSTYPIEGAVVFGRSSACDVCVDLTNVSRRHAKIERVGPGEYVVEDLSSRNGTLVNGVPIRRYPLSFGDRVSLGGEAIFLFSQRDQLQEQLLHQQRMESIGQLAGGVAHDFNNLLGTILGNASVLSNLDPDTLVSGKEVQDIIDDVRTAATRAAQLTEQLLGFARRDQHERKPTDVSELAVEAVRLCRRTFDPSVRIDLDVDPCLTVRGDRNQLHQVLMNLLMNARDAVPNGGGIRVKLAAADGQLADLSKGRMGKHLLVSVSDDGMGMTESVRQRVFEPFFTTKEVGSGTGLGLAMVYGIVQNHGGEVRVTSTPGKGATFEVFLPLAESKSLDQTSTASGLRAPRLTDKGLVLVVDDEALYLRSAARLLELAGYEVVTAAGGGEALTTFSRMHDRIQLVVMDLVMPGVSGVDACRQIKQMKPDTKILVMSGCSDLDRAEELVACGSDGFLHKPFNREMLEYTIMEILDDSCVTEAA